MIFQELMKKYDAEEVYPVYHTYYAAKEHVGSAEEQQRHKDFCEFYDNLKKRKPMIGEDIIIASMYYGAEGTQIVTDLYFKENIEEEFDPNSPLKSMALSDVASLSDRAISDLERELRSGMPHSVNYSELRWAEVLGAEVFEPNVLSVGEVQMIAALLYELGSYGYDDRKIREQERKEREEHVSAIKFTISDEKAEPEDPQAAKELDEYFKKEALGSFRSTLEEFQILKAYCDEHNI